MYLGVGCTGFGFPPTSTLVSPLGTILVLVLIVEITSASATLVIKPLVEILLELAALVIETLVVSIVIVVRLVHRTFVVVVVSNRVHRVG